MPIRSKLALSFTAFVAVALGLFAAGFYVLEARSVKAQDRQVREETLQKLVAVCRETELNHSPIVAINYTRELKKDPSLHAASCLAMDGRIKAHTDPENIGALLDPDLRGTILAIGSVERLFAGYPNKDLQERLEPVRNGPDQIGVARILWDKKLLDQRLRSRLAGVIRRTAEISCWIFLLTLPAAFFMARNLTRPVDALVEGARRIVDNQLDHRIPNGRFDELGTLIDRFNEMAQKLGEVEKVKDRFLASLTHDMKNPLTGVIAGIKLVEMGPLTDSQKETCRLAAVNGYRLADYIDDILDLSKLQAGRMEFHMAPCFFSDLFHDLEELERTAFQQADVQLSIPASEHLPPMALDRKLILRVLTNLFGNALTYTPKGGGVSLTVDIVPGAHGREARVSVADTGHGIPAGEIDKIFGRFYQGEDNRRRARGGGGSGLGLAICQEIVEGHGGRIWAESEPGRGSLFRFTLPLPLVRPIP